MSDEGLHVRHEARDYRPDKVRKRYVRQSVRGHFEFCEVGDDRRYDLRQGDVDVDVLPVDVVAEAESRRGMPPAYVEWPL